MNTAVIKQWGWRNTLGVYLREAGFQFWGLVRMPGYALPTLLFPTMFYVFFGLIFNHGNGGSAATYMLATFGTFGIMAPSLFGFGVGVAMEREHGILALKRVSPMPPMAYFFAKTAMAMLFALIVVLLLFVLGALFGGVRLPHMEWFTLLLTLIIGTIPFCALGLAVGLHAGGQSSPAIVNLIYLPMSILSGLWVPLQLFPHWLQDFALTLPAYHLAQIGLSVIHMGDGSHFTVHLIYLLVFTAICLRFAQLGWRHIQDR
ncbi:MAG TPA: ABC transporter permease [Gammaproteobacteria bacterium]|nr:ABC transporter permease [Gammaproteobacteria bacterium]